MKAEQTPLKDCFLIHDTVINDERGYFFESFHQNKFCQITGLQVSFVQDNQSHSVKGVLRGLHFQTGVHSQAKLVRVLTGEVLDVAVDLRNSSPTFGKHFSVILSGGSHTQLFIPRGFAHGFLVLSNEVDFFYKCDNFYNKSAEGGVMYNNSQIGINWQLGEHELIISQKDLDLPGFSASATYF